MNPDGEDWLIPRGDRVHVLVKVIPGSSETAFAGFREGRVLARIAAAPEKGKANAALEALFAEKLGISRSSVQIVAGLTDRRKTVSLPAGSAPALRSLMRRGRAG